MSPSSSSPRALCPLSRPGRLGLMLVVAFLALAIATAIPAQAQEGGDDGGDAAAEPMVDILPVSGLLDPPVASTIIDLLDKAAARDSQLVILQVNGAGGVSVDMAELVAAIEDSPVPVAVMVAPDQGTTATASGAWGVVWAAADIRVVSQLGAVGPLLPVDLADKDDDAVALEVLASLAGEGDQGVVQRLRDETVPGLELEEAGLVDVLADSYLEVMDELNDTEVVTAGGTQVLQLGEDTTSRLSDLGLLDRMLHAAATPTFIYLLLVFGLALLAFELFQPGFGVAGLAGVVMVPFAIFGLTVLPVVWWALALLVIGLGLYVLDTAVAGFGPLTAGATVSFGVGSWFVFGTGALRNPWFVAVAITIAAFAFWVPIMTTILRAQAGPEGVELDALVGKLGIVRSMLNPEGHVYIDDALWRARLQDDGRLRVSAPIQVAGVDGAVLVVTPYVAGQRADGASTPTEAAVASGRSVAADDDNSDEPASRSAGPTPT